MTHTIAQQFFADPRLTQARQLILDALQAHQARLHVRGPIGDRQSHYQAILEQFARMRGGALYYPALVAVAKP